MTRSDTDDPKLIDLLDIAALQEILDAFAAITRTTVSLRDQDGKTLARAASVNPLCQVMAARGQDESGCRSSIDAVAREAFAQRRYVASTCQAGMTLHAAPVVMNGTPLGVIVMGHLPDRFRDPAEIDALARKHQLDRETLDRVFEHQQLWSDEQMSAAVGFLQLLANSLARFCQQANQLRQRVEELVTVYQLSAMLTGTRDLQDVLRVAASNVVSVLHVKACSIRLLNRATEELTIAAGYNLSDQYLLKGPVRVGENPIDSAALQGETVYIADVRADPRIRYPAQAEEEGLVSGLVTGMVFRGQPVGVMRVYTGEPHSFSAGEASLLRAVAAQAASAIENKRLTEEAIQSEIVNRQIKIAAEVQRRMVPTRPPEHAHIRFGTVYEPAYGLCGDFYDFLELRDGLTGIAIADVVGKGVPASLLMASVRSSLRAVADGLGPLDQVIARVNRQLCQDTLTQEFATLFYGVLSPDGRQLTYCNAGHDPPLLVRDGEITKLEIGGMLMGTVPTAEYKHGVVDLQLGDVLLLYTDGVVDAMNFMSETFGRERLAESLVRYAALQAGAIAPNILWDVRRFVGLAEQIDDVTMVSLKVVT
ncbi:MAG: SpoIIE family protein phosphatase [Phycisphaerae bacterium]|nr:SpoIIE family protein phosphatase [Phycisphaerae bacterium]